MIELVLQYIEEHNFLRYKDGKWYSVKDYPRVFYKTEELATLVEAAYQDKLDQIMKEAHG
jgi:lipocalin